MKRSLRIALLIFIAGAVAAGVYFFFFLPKTYSPDQSYIINILGEPDQFVIAYLPRGERELIRSEVWLYPTADKRIGFSGGKLAYIDSYQPTEAVNPTDLSPSDFYYGQSGEDINAALNAKAEEGTLIPGLTDTLTYYSPKALYVLDGGNLTYFQTLGAGDKSYLDAWEKEQVKLEATPTPTPTPLGWKKYSSTDIGMSIEYPPDWFLSDGVLSSYDTGYVEKNLSLPDKRLKCDFMRFDNTKLRLENSQPFVDGALSVQKGTATDLSEEAGPGLGDAVIFLIDDKSHQPMALLCYSYHTDFEPTLKQMFSTFSFISP